MERGIHGEVCFLSEVDIDGITSHTNSARIIHFTRNKNTQIATNVHLYRISEPLGFLNESANPRNVSASRTLIIVVRHFQVRVGDTSTTHRVEGGSEGGRNPRRCRERRIIRGVILYIERKLRHPAEGGSPNILAKENCMKRKRLPAQLVSGQWM